ncbi:hypothetical protein BD769DRAFT_1546852 [Suillus cothurnatus]|nr:hypothetical protein BD769DRAFT_1546852 [Suillus cothurnatus]
MSLGVLILYRTGVVLTTHIACPLTDQCEFIHARSILTCVDRRCCLLIERECIDSEQRWTVFNFPSRIQQLYGYHCAEIRARILSAAPGLSLLENLVQFSAAAVIIFEHSFYLFYQKRYFRSDHPVRTALQRYMASPHAIAVREAISTAVRAYQGNPSIWRALLPFERSQRKAELIKTILEVILQHRLCMFQLSRL